MISEKKMNEVVNYLEYVKIKEELEATGELLEDEKILGVHSKGTKSIKVG